MCRYPIRYDIHRPTVYILNRYATKTYHDIVRVLGLEHGVFIGLTITHGITTHSRPMQKIVRRKTL